MASLITSPLVKTYTLEQFWQLPEPPDGSKLELIAGVLYMTPPPDYKHDDIVKRLNRLLTRHLIEQIRFEMGIRSRPDGGTWDVEMAPIILLQQVPGQQAV